VGSSLPKGVFSSNEWVTRRVNFGKEMESRTPKPALIAIFWGGGEKE